MKHSAKTPAVLAALALALGALTACTAPSAAPDADTLEANRGERIAAAYEEAKANRPAPQPAKYTKPQSALIPGCVSVARFQAVSYDNEETWNASVVGLVTDRGPRDGATGEVTLDENGHPIAYTVAEGDMLHGISHRFCFDYIALAQLNSIHSEAPIHPGQVLQLAIDPTTPWEPMQP